MAFNSEVTCNWDSVNTVTVDVATGPVLYHLGNEAAQWQTTDAAEVDKLCAEVATMNERKERLEFLLDKAVAKFKAELAALYSSLRRGPRAIAAAVDAEWDQLSDSASVFDVDYPSCLETESLALASPSNRRRSLRPRPLTGRAAPIARHRRRLGRRRNRGRRPSLGPRPRRLAIRGLHARQQYRDRINRLRLQRQGRWHGIPPCRTVHVSAFNKHQNKATLQRLMRHHGFDLDEDTAVVEYHVTSSQRSGIFHYYGFVTFKHLDAAKLCVQELDRMDFDGHQGMTPIVKRVDGTVAHDILTFSFSKRNQNLDDDDEAEAVDSRRRSSSRAPPARRQGRAATPARRQASRAAVYDTDSDETGLEDFCPRR